MVWCIAGIPTMICAKKRVRFGLLFRVEPRGNPNERTHPQRSPGCWAIVIEIRDPETGRRKRKWHSFSGTKRQAQVECARLVSEVNVGTYVEPSKTTLAQFLDRWLDDVRTRVTPKTHERYSQICHKNIAPMLGGVPLAKLRPEQISDAYAKALATGRRKGDGGLAPRTVRQMHAIVKSALAQAVKWDILIRNPAAAVRGPKVGRAAMQTYDLEQTAELIEAARGTRVFIAILLAVLGGLRRGEISALRWRQVDLVAAQLAVVQSAEQTSAGVRYKEPKGGRARTIALSATLVTELRAHRMQQAEELLRFGKRLSDDDFVVMQADGSPPGWTVSPPTSRRCATAVPTSSWFPPVPSRWRGARWG